jgi:tetratricopeptide (TPR) repeat protein
MDKGNTKSTTIASSVEHTSIELPRRPSARTVQNFLVVWLDGNIDEDNDDYQNTITKLREVVNTVNTFTDVTECVNFVADIKTEKVFMIASGALGQTIVPVLHDMAQVSVIYIFCEDKARHEQWTQQWPKVNGVFTDMKPICEALKKTVQKCHQNTISMSFVATTSDTKTKNLDQLDQSFMYTQILKEILLTIQFEPQCIKEFIIYCREHFDGNTAELKNIDKFEKEYRQYTPVWWYTYPYFLHSVLNRALRSMEVDLIIKLGFFIRDLHEHITKLHSEQYAGHTQSTSFTVFRGQGLSQTDFDQLMKTKGGLLSFNNFLSTSKNRLISLNFAWEAMETFDLIGILFVLNVDSSVRSTPFADVLHVTDHKVEEEILFSMHSIFRIGQIKQIDGNNRLWEVNLSLTSDNDPQLHALTERIRAETCLRKSGWYRLGYLLIKLSQFDKAQEVYETLLDQTFDDHERANIYYMLGKVKRNQGKYAEAISYLEKSIEIDKRTLPPDHPSLASAYDDIGSVYNRINECSKALSSQEQALEIRQKTFPPNHLSLANSYSNLGNTYNNMGQYSKALSFHEKALEIYQKTLPPNHPYTATAYNNIGVIYSNMDVYSKALVFYEHACDIGQRSLPENHSNLKLYKENVENMLKKL